MAASEDKTELFEKMPVRKAITVMAVPTIISQLINLIYNIVDTFFIGRTGNAYMVAAVSVAYTLFVMTIALANLYGLGGGSLVARLMGKGELEKAHRVSAYSFYGAIGIAMGYSLLIVLFANPLLKVLGASEQTIVYAKQYVYTVVVAGDVPIILSAVLAHLLRNSGYSKQASLGLSMGGVLNIALDPLFMFVIMPEGKEVLGAAAATLIANIFACMYLFTVYRNCGKTTQLSCSIRKARKLQKKEINELYMVGVPSAILTGLFDLANMFLNAKMAFYGAEAVAALGIVMKAERLPNAVCVGLCQGMMPIIAYNYTAKNKKRMNEVIRRGTVWGFVFCIFSVTVFEIFSKQITGVFCNTKASTAQGAVETLAYAALYLRIRCLASPLQFMNYRSSFCMQAMGDGKDTLLHAILRELLFYIPSMFLLNSLFGMYGLVSSLIAGEGCGMIVATVLLNRWIRKTENK